MSVETAKIMLPKDREYLVLDNLNLVHYVVRRQFYKHPQDSDYEDYVQEGTIGLILAAIRFDETKGFKFATFAVSLIRGSIQQYRRDYQKIHFSRSLKDIIFKVISYTNQGFSLREIEELTGINDKDIRDALNVSTVVSLEHTINLNDNDSEDTSHTVGDTVSSKKNDYEELLSEENCLQVIQTISEKETNSIHKAIWEEWVYGLFYGEKLTQKYFAKKYDMSQTQISRILKKFKNEFLQILTQD